MTHSLKYEQTREREPRVEFMMKLKSPGSLETLIVERFTFAVQELAGN